MTKAELLSLLEQYPGSEEIVFITHQWSPEGSEIVVHEEIIGVEKGHSTVRHNADGSKSMPVGIWLNEGKAGKAGVMGGMPR
jgi:hypothetical protein